jgi:hypothetical protein
MPQMLHAPGFASSTSGCIGHVHDTAGSCAAVVAATTRTATRIAKARTFMGLSPV